MKTGFLRILYVAFIASMLSALPAVAENEQTTKVVTKGVADSVALQRASIYFADEVLLHDMDLSITSIDSTAVPELDYGMFNVSVEGEGFRFLPHGTHFGGDGATVKLGYDRTRIPSGYTEDDIRTYYYDTDKKNWVALQLVEVDKQQACVISRTTHFTDMINGVIVAPESPETSAFTPTMMNDIKAADPTSKINIITPPTANNRGSANLQYPFEMPPARNGMQPQVALSYNSDGGSGWAGEGWDISIPSITVDTRWGVPRYNTTYETETYLLNGQMLATMNDNEMTVAHRTDSVLRQDRRQFFMRQGGDFSLIIREGNSIDNYYWVVTDRNGVKYTYGGDANARLSGTYIGVDGIPRTVVAEWKLTRIEEPHGDYIVYEYEDKNDTQEIGMGGFSTSPVYLKNIHVFQKKDQTTNIETTTVCFHPLQDNGNIKLKTLQANNARYGFLTSSNRLLGEVEVKFLGETLRSYSLEYYNDTTFHKDLLRKVSHLDNNGDIVSFQEFDYYDDVVSTQNSYSTFCNDFEQWESETNIKKKAFNTVNPILNPYASSLGGTSTSSNNASIYTGVGTGFKSGKSLTGGASFAFGQSTSTGESTLIDIDGDGLPDRVFKQGKNNLIYCPQIFNGDSVQFGSPISIHTEDGLTVSDFSLSKSTSITGGAKGYPGIGPAFFECGADLMSSTNKTTHYFSDVNGDGLVDIVANGEVYFNHIENGIPTFTRNSCYTPSPINNRGQIEISNLTINEESQDSILKYSPMQDVVRYWSAPFDGNIRITGTVQLTLPDSIDVNSDEYLNRDGVKLSIQHNNTVKWQEAIGKDDFTEHQTLVSGQPIEIYVNKDDKILFRVQCGEDSLANGDYDMVKWKSNINYIFTNPEDTLQPPSYVSTYNYTSSEIQAATSCNEVPVNDHGTVKGIFIKPVSDDVLALMIHYTSNETLSYEMEVESDSTITLSFLPEQTYNGELTIPLPNDWSDGVLRFEMYSPTNINWDLVSWKPYIEIIKDTIPDTLKIEVSPLKKIYSDIVLVGSYYRTLIPKPNQDAKLYIHAPGYASGEFTLTLKSEDELYINDRILIENGALVNDTTYYFSLPANTNIWAEAFVDDPEFANQIEYLRVGFNNQPPANWQPDMPFEIPVSDVYIYSYPSDNNDLGSTYHQWGQFIYNATGDRCSHPILMSQLIAPQDSASANPLTMPISYLTPKTGYTDYFIGPRSDIYIHGDTISTARLGYNNVTPTSLYTKIAYLSTDSLQGETLKGTMARGITLIQESSSSDVLASAGVSFASITYNHATGSGISKNAFMDMNGDGFPDIVTENSIQYTNTLGGFADGGTLDRRNKSFDDNEMELLSKNHSDSWGLGGSPVHSFSTSKKDGSAKVSEANARVGCNISISLPENRDEVKFSYIDINGDGLPDMLSKWNDGYIHARLNLGYGFTSDFVINESSVIHSTYASTETCSLGGSFNIDAGSFNGGFSGATTTSNDSTSFVDINGDGLTDIVRVTGSDLAVKLNLGNSFAEEVHWNGVTSLGTTQSSTKSENIAVSIDIRILGGKLTITPGYNHSNGMSSPTFELRDIDGDGFIDILSSEDDSIISVKRSSIARTNKLRTVTNSLGGKFTLDYKHNTPTYGLPGGKWVMSSVEIDYGIHGDYEIPNTKNVFEYNNGCRDRHEREFLGFGQVITKNIDTQNDMALYRQTVEEYDTGSIYSAGNLLHSYITKPTGNKLTEIENQYYSYGLTNTAASGVNGGKYKFNANFSLWNDRGAAYCPLRYTKNTQYENGNNAIMSESWNSYFTGQGDHGLLSNYRYSDKGSLDSLGTGNYDYQTAIDYNTKLSGSNYYFGQPNQVVVTDSNGLFHLVQATYSSAYPTQLTSVKRAVKPKEFDPDTPVTPLGGDDLNGAMRPGQNPLTFDPDTHGYTIYTRNYDFAETNYSYDAHGNLSSVRLPAPSRSDTTRIWYSYDYEDVLNTHISRVTDAFSLSNIVDDYDFRYGVSRHGRDRNHQQSWTSYDNLGRMTGVRTPFDGPYGNTISFSYHQIADTANGVISTPAYSVTTYYFRNYDITGNESYAFTDTMRVVTFVDGFGRPVQVRKDGVVWDGSHNVDRVIVTGRTMYDCYGRAVRSYHPSTSSSSTVMAFEPGAQSVEFFTETEYDELDRPLKVTLPDTTNTSYAYSLVGNALKTTVTDAEGNSSATVVNGSGKTVQSIQYKSGPDSEALTTAFAYDGIGRLVSVTDTEGNVTESTYDYGDRRTRVVHPASGETNYTYDRLGNVLTVQTANLKDGGSRVEYTYDRGRPTSVVYPEHPENNVYYHYGTADEPDTHNDLYGRLKFVEDGSGGTEYRYDAMGNVNRMRRTLSIPGEMVATANFEWRYDSFGKLLGMTYPAIRSAYGERVAYRYDRSGQLQSVYNNNTEGYYYARDIGYDRFGSQIHMEYGNGASTDYAYIPTNRRLRNISVSTSGSSAFTFGRAYTYDRVGNILALTSSSSGQGTLFPPVSHEYSYDNLYRLVGSRGYTIDGGQMSAIDSLTMTYDDMYRITGKTLVMSQQNVQFDGTLSAGYTLGYNYNTATGRKFQMSSVTDVNYRVASATVSNSDKIDERHTYEYDRNGNITYAGTARKRGDRAYRDRTREEKFRWDEANRLLAISQDGYVSHYFYDASGERTVKMHGGNSAVFVNSQMSGRETGALSFSAYFNPYFSIHDGTRFTKHLYIGSERIASMTGELDEDYYDVANNNNIVHAGVEVYVNTNDLHIPYTDRCYAMRDSIDGNYSYFGLHSGLDWSGVQLRALSLPCHGEEDGSVNNGGGSIPRSQGSGTGNDYPSRYGSIWYFHKDHLGSSTLITDGTGSISQQVEYLPYGEVFLEKQHNSDPSQPLYATPYKFNGKELDEETGLYYYGARYMNPRLSIWYATDPMQEKYPNISSYAYCEGNPIIYVDVNGNWVKGVNGKRVYYNRNNQLVNASKDFLVDANQMSKTSKGREILKKMLDSSYMISISYDNTNSPRIKNKYILGKTEIIVKGDKIDHAIITVYKKNIRNHAKNTSRYKDLTTEEIRGSNMAHEGTHGTEKAAMSRFNKNSEQNAIKSENYHLRELRQQKNKKTLIRKKKK